MFSLAEYLTLVIITSLLIVLCLYLSSRLSSQNEIVEAACHVLDEKKSKIARMERVTDSNTDALIALQRKYDLLFISKLKIIVSNNPDCYKEEIAEELKLFLKNNNSSKLFDIALILTKDVNMQIKSIYDVLEQSPEFKLEK